MQLSPDEQRKNLKTINNLLNENGYFVITLRHRNFEDVRTAFQLNAKRAIAEAKQHGLSLILSNKH